MSGDTSFTNCSLEVQNLPVEVGGAVTALEVSLCLMEPSPLPTIMLTMEEQSMPLKVRFV